MNSSKKTSPICNPSTEKLGITPNYFYILSTEELTIASQNILQNSELSLEWFANRRSFLLQALDGCNLLAQFIPDTGLNRGIIAWFATATEPATAGLNFTEEWQLDNGHTAYLFAPANETRPILSLLEPIPLVSDCDLPYQLAGFFATHRADGVIEAEFLDANGQILGNETFTITHSDKYAGGKQLQNYGYYQWRVHPPATATEMRLQIRLGKHAGVGLPNSFLFATHLFFGVMETQTIKLWSPFSQTAVELSREARNPNWQSFALAQLPQNVTEVSVKFQEKNLVWQLETTLVPDYLSSYAIPASQKIYQFFDPAFYAQQQSGHLARQSPEVLLEHYLMSGWKTMRSPTPYFDVSWYLVCNKEVRERNIEPLQHFIEQGSKAHSSPHPLFDAAWYYRTYLAPLKSTAEPLWHYITEGWRLGYQPHPLFWTTWYVKKYLTEKVGEIEPFYHFLTEGWRNHCQPNPLFNIRYYLKEYSEKQKISPDPLSHYVHVGWKENYQPHSLFDSLYYVLQSGFNLQQAQYSPLQAFFATENAPSPHPLFDADFYREQTNAEIKVHPLVDYLERGWQGKIDPHPLFSKAFYYRHTPEAVKNQTDALLDYVEKGWQKNQPVHPLFDGAYYLEKNPKAFGCNPLRHYLVHGWQNGFACRNTEETFETIHKTLPGSRQVLLMPDEHLLPFAATIESLKHCRIGVFAHIFFPELALEMITAANHIPTQARLFISTDSLTKRTAIQAVCEKQSKHAFEIRVLPNRGRDIAPMVCGFRDRLLEVDYGVHIHSKRSSHFDATFSNAWRQHSIFGNLGSTPLIQNILGLLQDDSIGAYMPDHYPPMRPLIQWTGNFATAKKLLQLCGEDLSKEHCLDFPSGSMFWFKTKALQPLLNLNLRFYHFEPEQGQTDNTLAHALERSFFYFVETAGFAWAIGRKVSGELAAKSQQQLQKFKPLQLANRFFPKQQELGAMRHYFAQCTRFLIRPSLIQKPRLNLLIPTINIDQAKIDIQQIFTLFEAIRQQLGSKVDARIITTDASPSTQYNLPLGYILQSPLDADCADQDTLVDAAQRFRYPFFVRQGDIFMATTWWTANHAIDVMQQQQQLFGHSPQHFVYFMQTFEPALYPFSTQYVLAEQSYRYPEKTIPIFNTPALFEYFKKQGYFTQGHCLQPTLNPAFTAAIQQGLKKEKIVLLSAASHQENECFAFVNVVVQTLLDTQPEFWADWEFFAVSEKMLHANSKICSAINLLSRVSIEDYAQLASRAALGITLKVAPESHLTALELAEAGVLVLTNATKEMLFSAKHDNIFVFDSFELSQVADQFQSLAQQWLAQPDLGWSGKKTSAEASISTIATVATTVTDEIYAKLKAFF